VVSRIVQSNSGIWTNRELKLPNITKNTTVRAQISSLLLAFPPFIHQSHGLGRSAKFRPPKDKDSDFCELVGHSQPVYSLSFSPDNKFLLSSSADGTARLWSMDTKQNLVVYKGHSFPVWGVTFSPMGYYFATASHDRTARLWTTSVHYPHRIFAGHLADVNVRPAALFFGLVAFNLPSTRRFNSTLIAIILLLDRATSVYGSGK